MTDLYIDELFIQKVIIPVNNTEGTINYMDVAGATRFDIRIDDANSITGNSIRYGKPANETITSSSDARIGGYRWVVEYIMKLVLQ